MIRKFILIRKYVVSLSGKDTFIYFNDIEKPYDTLGMFGFDKYSLEFERVPFTKLELISSLGQKVFYNKSELAYNKNGELVSIKCGDSFLPIKKYRKRYSYISEKEINRLMKQF